LRVTPEICDARVAKVATIAVATSRSLEAVAENSDRLVPRRFARSSREREAARVKPALYHLLLRSRAPWPPTTAFRMISMCRKAGSWHREHARLIRRCMA